MEVVHPFTVFRDTKYQVPISFLISCQQFFKTKRLPQRLSTFIYQIPTHKLNICEIDKLHNSFWLCGPHNDVNILMLLSQLQAQRATISYFCWCCSVTWMFILLHNVDWDQYWDTLLDRRRSTVTKKFRHSLKYTSFNSVAWIWFLGYPWRKQWIRLESGR